MSKARYRPAFPVFGSGLPPVFRHVQCLYPFGRRSCGICLFLIILYRMLYDLPIFLASNSNLSSFKIDPQGNRFRVFVKTGDPVFIGFPKIPAPID